MICVVVDLNRPDAGVQVRAQRRCGDLRRLHRSHAGSSIDGAEERLPPLELAADMQLSGVEVDVVDLQAQNLPQPQAAACRQVDGRRQPVREQLSQSVHLLRRRDEARRTGDRA